MPRPKQLREATTRAMLRPSMSFVTAKRSTFSSSLYSPCGPIHDWLKQFPLPRRVVRALHKPRSIAEPCKLPQSESIHGREERSRILGSPRDPVALAQSVRTHPSPSPAHRPDRKTTQFGIGNSSTRLLAWSTMTARLVNWSMATPNCADPGRPSVCRVFIGFDSESTMDTDFPAKLAVTIAPVCGFTAKAVGLMPTDAWFREPESGLNDEITLAPLELI